MGRGLLVTLVVVAVAVPGLAATIDVADGSIADWGSIAPVWGDPNEAPIADQWDIANSYFHAGVNPSADDRWFFRLDMYGSGAWSGPDYALLVFDTDLVGSTGGGILGGTWDAWAEWDLASGTGNLYTWGGSSWGSPTAIPVGGGTYGPGGVATIEWEIDPVASFGVAHDSTTWKWGSFVEGGSTDPDDYSPDNLVPEPGTLALFGLGLLGAAVVYRRRKTG